MHVTVHASVRAGLQHTAVTSFLCPCATKWEVTLVGQCAIWIPAHSWTQTVDTCTIMFQTAFAHCRVFEIVYSSRSMVNGTLGLIFIECVSTHHIAYSLLIIQSIAWHMYNSGLYLHFCGTCLCAKDGIHRVRKVKGILWMDYMHGGYSKLGLCLATFRGVWPAEDSLVLKEKH